MSNLLRCLRRLAPLLPVAALVAGCGGTPVTMLPPVTAAPPAPQAPPPVAPPEVAAYAPVFPAQNRPDVRGTQGAVVSDHPLATAAGHDVLRRGGSAVDAAIATAAVLAVVRPHMNGVGGDAFALILDAATGRVHALNGSGAAGSRATPEFFRAAGHEAIPYTGALSVSVPGAVDAWAAAHARFGRLPFAELLAPAVSLAREGFAVSTRLAADFSAQGDALDAAAAARFLPSGAPPRPGTRLRNPELADLLEAIGRRGADAFYRGAPATAIATFVADLGGTLTPADFAAHRSEWTEPLAADHLGHTFFAFPPNTQGVTQLQQLRMAAGLDLAALGANTPDYLHALIEIKKLAFADRDRWVADPVFVDVPVTRLLDERYLASRLAAIDPARAATGVEPGFGGAPVPDRRSDAGSPDGPDGVDPERRGDGDTVYLTVVDAEGNAVSWIQSLYAGFGSGLMEPSTGVVLHNRGTLFSLDAAHPNVVSPGKRPFHTLSPLLALRDGALAFTLGTPGGDAQTQSLLQIIHNLLVFGLTPQEAVEAPRYRSEAGLRVALEDRIDPATVAALRVLGHDVRLVSGWTATFGGAQMIHVDPVSGTLTAAADPRREAYAIAH